MTSRSGTRTGNGWSHRIRLVGRGGEPVSLARSINSHGLVSLPPMRPEERGVGLEAILRLKSARPRLVRIEPSGPRHARITMPGRAPGTRTQTEIVEQVRHILRMEEDLSPFYETAAADPDLAWVASGAGRMIRSQSVFEDIVKTICTTNCAWSATVRMVSALVTHLGEPASNSPAAGPLARAFPTPEAMASADEDFYRSEVKAGYRAAYLIELAGAVAAGELDVETWGSATVEELPDDELAELLLALPGVGPYAAAHVMMMLGRYSRLILDSWTRPTYLRIAGKKRAADTSIERRFRPHGPFAGLAFWLYLTRDWVEEEPVEGGHGV